MVNGEERRREVRRKLGNLVPGVALFQLPHKLPVEFDPACALGALNHAARQEHEQKPNCSREEDDRQEDIHFQEKTRR